VIRRIAVIIPAADEEQRIGRCLLSVVTARAHLYRTTAQVSVQIIVVLDSCQDNTAARAAGFGSVRQLTIHARNVGAARRAGVDAVLTDGGPASELWLADTDADSQVPANWLSYMLAESRRGAHLVLGTVLPGPALGPAVRADWLSRHQLREGHSHVHGANFGIRGDAYLALGGWPPMVTGEDVELAYRAARAGYLRITRTASIPVVTSTRHHGRAPRGFSSYLHAMSQSYAGTASRPGVSAARPAENRAEPRRYSQLG
jgi:glycosyltransferase involved in cell wall biosynthesis